MAQFLIAFDQLINTLFGGWADETLSARMYREKRYGWTAFIDMLFFWQENHCYSAYMSEMERKQLPKEYRND